MNRRQTFIIAITFTLVLTAICALVGTAHALGTADARPVPVVSGPHQNTLRALNTLNGYGYHWTTPAGALKAIKHWQKANGLDPTGQVDAATLRSLKLDHPASGVSPGGVTAVAPQSPQTAVPAASLPEQIIRDIWPNDLEDKAVSIATRESRLQPTVINRNGDATGLFQIMWSVHRGWLCPQLNICQQADLQDARLNATAAFALYQRDGGWGPWKL